MFPSQGYVSISFMLKFCFTEKCISFTLFGLGVSLVSELFFGLD